MKPDLTYLPLGLFVAFFGETPAGEEAWDEIARQTDGTGKILACHLASTLAQLRAAGLTVKRAPKPKPLSDAELASLLAG